ncbi:MAG: glycosyltransferase [Flavobacteriales bacterium]|nr:glycosyltransferase [Flavobacteriales bacterium]
MFTLTFSNIMLWLAGLFFLIQLMFYVFIYLRISVKGKREAETNDLKPLSVVICARNEEQNILNYLPKILAQDYPKFQVILINDRSWDETWDVMEAMARKDERITLVNIPDSGKDGFAKKFALTVGIKAAKHDQLIFIDADCYPETDQWLKKMASKFSTQKRVVLGAGAYLKHKGLTNKLIRFDTCTIAAQYLSFAKAGIPYMGVGRNLAYKNELYDSVRGFKSHYHIPSGDDDLFVNEVADSQNTTICFEPDAITFSEPEETFRDWRIQKRRHMTTGKFYKMKHKLLLGLFPLSYVLFLVFAIIAGVTNPFWYIPLTMIGVRLILQYAANWRVFKTMQSKDVFWMIPAYELIMLILNPYLSLTGNKYNKLRL